MNWLVDNATGLTILLSIVAAGLVAFARLQQQARLLIGAAGVAALIVMLWLVVLFVPSDRKQIEDNVHAMKNAVVAGDADRLANHISKDFRHKNLTRDKIVAHAKALSRVWGIRSVRISKFAVDELDRPAKFARASFRVTFWVEGRDEPAGMFLVRADFVLEDDQWKLSRIRFFNAVVNQDQEMDIPIAE